MTVETQTQQHDRTTRERADRAAAIAAAGGIEAALSGGSLPTRADLSLSEALVLGLLRQGVRRYFAVFGHGSTEIGEVLRVYQAAGLAAVHPLRNEIEASHAAAALALIDGQRSAVVTSIGPGAMQALAASLVPASDGLGVWYLLGDETSEDEGYNMQQIPRREQGGFLRLFSAVGPAYSLHTPLALPSALRRGLDATGHPHRAQPFFLLLPMNTQGALLPGFNLGELPSVPPPGLPAAADNGGYQRAAAAIHSAERVVVRVGGGARAAGAELLELLELADGVAVTSPLASGAIPYRHPRNMTVAGSKGSICGNRAMEQADLLVTVGSRAVCQSDSSRTGWPRVGTVVSINTDPADAGHYNRSIPLWGEAAATLRRLNEELRRTVRPSGAGPSAWLADCSAWKAEWEAFKAERYRTERLFDEVWGREVLTQPAAIKAATDWARSNGAVALFDAGDVQANGFQIVEEDRPGQSFTETGASYMGWAVSALLATGLADRPFYGLAFTGDGSLMMSPQVLIDGVEHGATGCILLLDNRRMGAISSLQRGQYGRDFATCDRVAVDYAALARAVTGVVAFHGGYSTAELVAALDRARAHPGLSLIHLPVYWGDDPLGGLGAYGRWNVGPWVEETQRLRHRIGL